MKKLLKPTVLVWIGLGLVIAPQVQAQNERAIGSVQSLERQAYVLRDQNREIDLSPGSEIFRQDTIQTLEDALLVLAMHDGSQFVIDENTRVRVSEYVSQPEPQGRFGLLRGRMRAVVSGLFSSRSDAFQVETTEGVMGVQGTDFLVEAPTGESRVYVFEGSVMVNSRDPGFDEGVVLTAGQFTRVRLGEPVAGPFSFSIVSADRESVIGSGSEQQMRSLDGQAGDLLLRLPDISPLLIPPEPNRPGRD